MTLKGERLALTRRETTIELYTNGRTLGISLDQAQEILFALEAILNGRVECLCTPDLVEVPRTPLPPDNTNSAATTVDYVPTIEDLKL